MSLMLLLKSDYKNLLWYNQQMYEENTRLKELNRELVEVLEELTNVVDWVMLGYKIENFTTQPAKNLLAKAVEEVGE